MKERIKESGLTITAISKKLNINNSTFRSYLSGIRQMPDEVKKDLNKLLTQYEKIN